MIRRRDLGEIAARLSEEHSASEMLPWPPNGDAATSATQPWFVRVLLTLAAWAAALLILVSAMWDSASQPDLLVLVGIGVALAAVGLAHAARRWDVSSGMRLVADQSALAGSILARLLIASGVSEMFRTDWLPDGTFDSPANLDPITVALLALVIVEIVLFSSIPEPLQRFLATAAAPIWLAAAGIVEDRWIVTELLFLLTAGLAALVFTRPDLLAQTRLWRSTRTIGYGLATGAGAIALMSLLTQVLGTDEGVMRPWVSWLMGGGIAFLGWRAAPAGPDSRRALPLVGLPLIVGMLTGGAPGLSLALGGLVVAFYAGERPLFGLASAYLAVFLWQFYYMMELSFLEKAAALAGTGLALLGAAAWLHWTARGEGLGVDDF
jgi:hypothetical protein